ncbi:uncharacterized protein [Diadema antillarum]|uniref:uncharacterized protein n=1 Tax=Diadema antillarum TaxID=105358 RepID=UPI003A87B288
MDTKGMLIFCGVLAACVVPLHGVTCYSCAYVSGLSPDDEPCLDPFDPTVAARVDNMTCDGLCDKTVIKVDNQVTSLFRSCNENCNEGCFKIFGINTCAHCCSEDHCNSAAIVNPSIVLIVALLGTIHATFM